MTTPEKAAPIPAEVLVLAEEAGRAIWDDTSITPSKVRKAIARAIMQDRADRASQEERAAEDERDRLRALAFEQMMAETSDALDEDEGSFALSFLIRHGALTHEDRAHLRSS